MEQTSSASAPSDATKQAKVTTAIEAITKISKILEQLTPADRKRVLAFVNEGSASSE